MDKKDIYEHLAKIYLDASSKRKKRPKKRFKSKEFFFLNLAVFVGILILFLFTFHRNKSINSEIALVLQPGPVKINFNFNPIKKEVYSVDLNNLDLSKFSCLEFFVKKANYDDDVFLRIEFTSAFKEKSEIYVKNITHKWQKFKILFCDFKNISEWSDMTGLAFAVEEWNVKSKKGIVYIDNVKFLR